jgi:hypothetical protein
MTNIQDNQNPKAKPSQAEVDELLKQLEALNQEIAAKTVVDQPQLAEKKDETEKLEAPPIPPAIDSSQEISLPVGDKASSVSPSNDQETTRAKELDLDSFIDDLEAKIAEKDEKIQEEATTDQVKPVEEQSQPQESAAVEENFARQRPSLDLSTVGGETTPSLTLKDGQLEENKSKETPSLTLTPPPVAEPKASVEPVTPTPSANQGTVNEENLESQNIFTMLGLENLEETEKEAFLADLEKLIWDNFIEVELPLLLNNEERTQAEQILADNSKTEDERKEALLVYLEKFVPNLEEVMYKKALSLKKEMFEERLNKLRNQATENNNLSLIADLDQIQELIVAKRYKTATELLNKA